MDGRGGSRLTLLHPVAYEDVRGGRFHETFVDRSKWPRFIRQGQAATRAALAAHRQEPAPQDAPRRRRAGAP